MTPAPTPAVATAAIRGEYVGQECRAWVGKGGGKGDLGRWEGMPRQGAGGPRQGKKVQGKWIHGERKMR